MNKVSKTRFWLLNILVLVFACSYLFYIFYQTERDRKIKEILEHQKIHARQAARGFNELFEKWNSILLYLSEDSDIVSMNGRATLELNLLLDIFGGEIKGITRVNSAGKILYTTPYYPNSIGADISYQKHMINILANHKPVVSDVFYTVQGFRAIVIHYPIFKKGRFEGTIAFLLNFQQISKKILDEIKIGNSGYAWMLSREGIELYCPISGHPGKSIFETSKGFPELISLARKMIEGKEGVASYSYNRIENRFGLVEKTAYFLPVKINNTFWSIAVVYSKDEITASLATFRNNLIIIFSFVLIGGIFIAFFGIKAWVVIKETAARKIAEKDLDESEKRFEQLIKGLPQLVWTCTPEGLCDFLSTQWVEYTGIPESDQLGSNWLEQVHPEDLNEFIIAWNSSIEDGSNFQKEFRIRRHDGVYRWFDSRALPLFDLDGNIVKWFGSSTDIQEGYDIKSALKISEERYRLISSAASDYMFSSRVNEKGNLYHDWVGGAFELITGYNLQEYISRGGWRACLYPGDIEKDNQDFEKLNNNQPITSEIRTITKSGNIVWVHVYASPVWDEKRNRLIGITGAVQNITERKQIELALIEREELLEETGRIAKMGGWEFDTATLKGTWTKEVAIIHDGDPNDESNVEMGINFYIGKSRELISDAIKEAVEIGKPYDLELEMITAKGNHKWVRTIGHPVKNGEKVVKVRGSFQDITERKLAEEVIRQSEEKFHTIFNLVPDALILTTLKDGAMVDVNDNFCKTTGYSREELIGKTTFQINLWKNISDRERYIKDLLKNKRVYNMEADLVIKAGGKMSCLVSGELINFQNELYIVGAIHDITDRKRAEEELKRLYTAIEQSPASIVLTNIKGQIQYVNKMFTKISGFSREEVKNKYLRILEPAKSPNKENNKIWETILGGSEWRGEYFNKRKDGSLYWESTLISPMTSYSGQMTNFLAIQEDITEKKKNLEELILAKDKAEEAIKVKNVFLANMSHELRTPLIGILGYSEMLSNELKKIEYLEMARGIKRSGLRLLNTLNLILDLTRIESDKFELNIKTLNLADEIEFAYYTFNGAALDKKINFTKQIIHRQLYAKIDDRIFKIILENLLNNAIKFTNFGSITIVAGIEKNKTIYIEVRDTGIGIAKEHYEVIFEEFRQVSEGISRDYQGTGLGLSITKKYVEILGGTISVKSEVGVGSSFVIRFPLVEHSAAKPVI